MQEDELKEKILDMLEKDKTFRNAIAGLVGYKELLDRIARLDRKTSRSIARLEARLSERIAKVEARIAELDKKIADVEARLSERIAKVEARIAELEARIAELDKKIADVEARLTAMIIELRSQVGGVSSTLGMMVESEARRTLREYLMDQGYRIHEIRRRVVLPVDGESVEIDIYGKVRKDGALIELLAEAKSRVSVSDVNTFMDKAMKLERIRGKCVKALLAFRIDDEAYDRAKELDVMLIQL